MILSSTTSRTNDGPSTGLILENDKATTYYGVHQELPFLRRDASFGVYKKVGIFQSHWYSEYAVVIVIPILENKALSARSFSDLSQTVVFGRGRSWSKVTGGLRDCLE